jgi:DNA-binding transcriptional LysR family regulator
MKMLAPAGVTPRRVREVMLTEVIIEMVRGGMGVAALSRWAVAPQLASGALIGLRVTEQGWRRTWSAAQLRDKNAPACVDEFIRLLKEHPIPTSVPLRKSAGKKTALPLEVCYRAANSSSVGKMDGAGR